MITISECYLTLGEYFLETDMFKAFGYFEEAARNGSGKAAMKVAIATFLSSIGTKSGKTNNTKPN